jgi:hypothetical protein
MALGIIFGTLSCARDTRDDDVAEADTQQSVEEIYGQAKSDTQSADDWYQQDDERMASESDQPVPNDAKRQTLDQWKGSETERPESHLSQSDRSEDTPRSDERFKSGESALGDENYKSADSSRKEEGLKREDASQEMTRISGTVHCTLDEHGNIKSCEIRDEKNTSFVIHKEGLGKDLERLTDAKIQATGRPMDADGQKVFYIDSYEAVLEVPGRLAERGESLVLNEIAFEESPITFNVVNRKDELQSMGVPFDKEIKANGIVSKGMMKHDRQQDSREQISMDQHGWNFRIDSYQPLETVVGVISMDNRDGGDMQLRLEEEESGVVFKDQGRTFEIVNDHGKGKILGQKYANRKVECYGTLSQTEEGTWSFYLLACKPLANEESRQEQNTEEQPDQNQNQGEQE